MNKSIIDKLSDVSNKISKLTEEKALILKLIEQFPDLELIPYNKGTAYASKSLNNLDLEVHFSNGCSCCDDDLYFHISKICMGVEICSTIGKLFVGRSLGDGKYYNANSNLEDILKSYEFHENVIAKVKKFLDENQGNEDFDDDILNSD